MDNICKMKMMIRGDCKMIDKKLTSPKMTVPLFLIALIVFYRYVLQCSDKSRMA